MPPLPEDLKTEVGVRELHDHLSRYVHHVQGGAEVTITMRGHRVAKLVPVDGVDALADLRARGLVREPAEARDRSRPDPLTAASSVSVLVADHRR